MMVPLLSPHPPRSPFEASAGIDLQIHPLSGSAPSRAVHRLPGSRLLLLGILLHFFALPLSAQKVRGPDPRGSDAAAAPQKEVVPQLTGVEEGTVVSLGIALFAEVKAAINSLGTATAYAKAKTDGPDADDKSVALDFDSDHGLDWSLDAKSGQARGPNNVDDGQEHPYTPGADHLARIEIHYKSEGGVWKPNPVVKVDGRMQEFDGFVAAEPDDDPVKADERTSAAAAAAFSADGKSVDFKYVADAHTTAGGHVEIGHAAQAPIADPPFDLGQGSVFLTSLNSFEFQPVGADGVLIHPLFAPNIDLFHSYLQADESLFPVLRGYSGDVLQMKQDGYADRVAGTSLVLNEDPSAHADLTIAGAGLRFDELTLNREGRSDAELLAEYMTSDAVRVVAPEHAQLGYSPTTLFRQFVTNRMNISDLVGRDFFIPALTDGDLFGLALGVGGGIDDAVNLALDTEGHFLRNRALSNWDGTSPTTALLTGELNFHYEDASAMEDFALASPTPTPEPASLVLLATGLLGVQLAKRKRSLRR